MHDQHTIYSAAAAAEGRAMNSDEQRADRWARLARKREAEREPQGEAVRLLTPAPNQMPGQTSMRPGQFYCRYCDTPEAMPGHEC